MIEQLFDRVEQWEGPARERETTFDFLARGGRQEAVHIRKWMEEWYQKLPVKHREGLKSRLRSKELGKFMGAYFEMQVFATLRRLNCQIDIHPCFTETEGTVDFHVTNDKEDLYVEATVCGIGRGILSSNANEENAIRKIKTGLLNPHSDVWLSTEGELNTTLPRRLVLEPFEELLNRYTADEVRGLYPGPKWAHGQQRLSVSIQEGNWRLEGRLAPPIASDGKGQVIGPDRGGAVNGAGPLQRALDNKADDWKEKRLEGETFVIAVNACHSEFWWGDEADAILGNRDMVSEQSVFSNSLSGVNAVIVFDHAVLGAERGSRVKLYRNGNMPLPEFLRFLVSERTLGSLLGIE